MAKMATSKVRDSKRWRVAHRAHGWRSEAGDEARPSIKNFAKQNHATSAPQILHILTPREIIFGRLEERIHYGE